MRLVYVDEAGTASPKQEPFVTVAGVIVHADNQLVALENHLDRLVERHIPEKERDGFVFHATEIFNGGKKGKAFDRDNPYWTLDRRLKVADDLATIPKVFDLPIAFGWQERSKFGATFDTKAMTPHQHTIGCIAVSFLHCAASVDLWMRAHAMSEVCLLVMEDNDSARSTIRGVQSHHQDKRYDFEERAKVFFPLQRIKEDPLFQKKKQSSPLQVADFCAYVWKRFLMNQKDERYLRFFDPMRPYLVAEKPEGL